MDEDILEFFFKSRQQILDFAAELESTAKVQLSKQKDRELVQRDITEAISRVYDGTISIVFYGSRVTGLATKHATDLDFLINTDHENNAIRIACREQENWFMNKILKHIKFNEKDKWTNVKGVFSCRTPVLKLLHVPTMTQCDVTALGVLGVNNTQLMGLYLEYVPLLRQTILLVREWFAGLNFSNDIHNYAVSLMVLFYFQNLGYAASLADLKFESQHCRVDVTGYDYASYDSIEPTKFCCGGKNKLVESLNLYDILGGFFNFYANFDYEFDVICPLLGCSIKKKLFEGKYLKKLPTEMHMYVQIIKNGGEKLKVSDVCVQDPIDLSHNITKSTAKNFLQKFKTKCFETARRIKSIS